MATSPLHPDHTPPSRDRKVMQGHGTSALGPSGSSDSGSDIVGAGPDIGDADLDSDSDRRGTGERAAAGRDDVGTEGADIAPDRIERLEDVDDELDDEGKGM